MQITRLQGKQFKNEKPNLILECYNESDKGNICGFYRHENDDKITVMHWLNNEEKDLFNRDIPKYESIKQVLKLRFK